MEWRDIELVSVMLAPSPEGGGTAAGTEELPPDPDVDFGVFACPVNNNLLNESTSIEPLAALAATALASCSGGVGSRS